MSISTNDGNHRFPNPRPGCSNLLITGPVDAVFGLGGKFRHLFWPIANHQHSQSLIAFLRMANLPFCDSAAVMELFNEILLIRMRTGKPVLDAGEIRLWHR